MFYHIFPCFLLELWRERVCVGKRERVYLPSCSGLFCFFLLWTAFLSSLSLSFSPPPPPLPLFFFREGKTLLSTSRLELLLSAYLAILLFLFLFSSSSSFIIISHHGYLGKDCVSHIYHLPFPSLASPRLYHLKKKSS